MNPEVLIYTTRFCPYCLRAHMLLKSKKIEYTTINVGGNSDLWEEMANKSGRNTVPQIFIGDYHVGGYDDLAAQNRSGQLDDLLTLDQSI